MDNHEVDEVLDEHGKRITQLEISDATNRQRLNNIEKQLGDINNTLVRFENNYLTTTNSLMQTMSQIVVNTSTQSVELAKTKSSNNKDIIVKGIGIGGSIIAIVILGYFAMRGVSVNVPIF